MRRRTLILAAASTLVAVAGWLAWPWRTPEGPAADSAPSGGRSPRPIQDYIAERLDYLVIPDDVLDAFAADIERVLGPWAAQARPTPQLALTFLMSTDFFQHGSDERRGLSYVAFYHPYVTPCYNPLARFDA